MTEVLLTAGQWAAMIAEPLRDRGYQQTALGASVADFLAYKKLAGRGDRTLDQYERDIARACTARPGSSLEAFTTEDAIAVLTIFPARSRKRARAALNELFRWAYVMGRRDDNPMMRVPEIAATPQTYIETFTLAEQDALMTLDGRDGTLMKILFDAGLRKAEARHLTVRRANTETREIVIIGGKGGKDRVVPMTRRIADAVNDLVLLDGIELDEYLWYTQRGNQHQAGRIDRARPCGEGTFHRWWARALADADVHYRPRTANDPGRGNPHVARHTFALNWLRGRTGRWGHMPAGKPGRMETLSKAMGHQSVQTTIDLYGHLDVSDVAADLALIEAEV